MSFTFEVLTRTHTVRVLVYIYDWKFCEVNCVQEDTTEGTQQRWRTCNGSNCSGEDMEERSCLRPGICKGMHDAQCICVYP